MQFLFIIIKTWRCVFPGISFQGHIVAKLIELFHVDRIKGFKWFFRKIRRDISEIECITVTLAQGINLIEITNALCSDERIDGTCGNGKYTSLKGLG